MEDKVIVDLAVLNKTLEYLSTRPFNEVANLIGEIQKSSTVISPDAAKEETPDAE